jgi:hypothetical protein
MIASREIILIRPQPQSHGCGGPGDKGTAKIDALCKQGDGCQVMDASMSPKISLLRMGKEMEVFSRSQVWPGPEPA